MICNLLSAATILTVGVITLDDVEDEDELLDEDNFTGLALPDDILVGVGDLDVIDLLEPE